MPGLEKTSGKVSYGASGQNAKKGNTKKRVRGQEKKRARRKGKEAAQTIEAIRNEIRSEIFNMVVSDHINESKSIIREGLENRIVDYLDGCGIPKNDIHWSNRVLVFDGGMQQAIKAKECLLSPNSPLNSRGRKGLRQHYNKLVWMTSKVEASAARHAPEKISKAEWQKTPKDYKSMIKGKPYVLKMGKSGATELVPVEIVG